MLGEIRVHRAWLGGDIGGLVVDFYFNLKNIVLVFYVNFFGCQNHAMIGVLYPPLKVSKLILWMENNGTGRL